MLEVATSMVVGPLARGKAGVSTCHFRINKLVVVGVNVVAMGLRQVDLFGWQSTGGSDLVSLRNERVHQEKVSLLGVSRLLLAHLLAGLGLIAPTTNRAERSRVSEQLYLFVTSQIAAAASTVYAATIQLRLTQINAKLQLFLSPAS